MRRAVAIMVFLTWVLAGCSLDPESAASSQPGAPVQAHGEIVMVGGPAPGAPRPIGGARIRFVGTDESVTTQADDRGRFSFSAKPGRYTVHLIGHAPKVNGAFFTTRPAVILVNPGAKPINLAVDLP
jgi:hypothetical protein